MIGLHIARTQQAGKGALTMTHTLETPVTPSAADQNRYDMLSRMEDAARVVCADPAQ